jgi:hypothetical protein
MLISVTGYRPWFDKLTNHRRYDIRKRTFRKDNKYLHFMMIAGLRQQRTGNSFYQNAKKRATIALIVFWSFFASHYIQRIPFSGFTGLVG